MACDMIWFFILLTSPSRLLYSICSCEFWFSSPFLASSSPLTHCFLRWRHLLAAMRLRSRNLSRLLPLGPDEAVVVVVGALVVLEERVLRFDVDSIDGADDLLDVLALLRDDLLDELLVDGVRVA